MVAITYLNDRLQVDCYVGYSDWWLIWVLKMWNPLCIEDGVLRTESGFCDDLPYGNCEWTNYSQLVTTGSLLDIPWYSCCTLIWLWQRGLECSPALKKERAEVIFLQQAFQRCFPRAQEMKSKWIESARWNVFHACSTVHCTCLNIYILMSVSV